LFLTGVRFLIENKFRPLEI